VAQLWKRPVSLLGGHHTIAPGLTAPQQKSGPFARQEHGHAAGRDEGDSNDGERNDAARSPERKPSSRPVDLVHLSRYTLGERALEREVLQLFCAQPTIYLERLRAARSDKDWREAAHSLKGSAYAVGAWRTGAAAERAENLGAGPLSGEALAKTRAHQIGEIESSLR
jgi:HPt (histidine-containing phosphotransfer) domain-containing protein